MNQDDKNSTSEALEPAAQPQTWRERGNAVMGHPMAPIVVGVAVIFLAALYFFRVPGGLNIPLGRPAIVVFDPVRFINSQRALASIIATRPEESSAGLVLTQVAKQADAVIAEEAHGAAVLVKQAVVNSAAFPDITNAVLARFGLSADVPTVTTNMSSTVQDVAPTDSSFSRGKLAEDYRIELQAQSTALREHAAKQSRQADSIP